MLGCRNGVEGPWNVLLGLIHPYYRADAARWRPFWAREALGGSPGRHGLGLRCEWQVGHADQQLECCVGPTDSLICGVE